MILLAFLMGFPEWAWEKVSPIVYWVMTHPWITGISAGGFVAAIVGAYYLKKSREPLSEALPKEEKKVIAEIRKIEKKYEPEQ